MIDGLSFTTVGPVGLLSIAVVLILVGRLVPRRSLEDVQQDRDGWRAAHMLSEKSRTEMALQLRELLEYARLTDEFIRSLPHPDPTRRPPIHHEAPDLYDIHEVREE